MSATVRLPAQLRLVTGGESALEVEPGTVRELIEALEKQHPGIGDRLLDESGGLRRFVNVFVDDEDVRFLDGLDTTVPDGASVSIVPAVAGGQ